MTGPVQTFYIVNTRQPWQTIKEVTNPIDVTKKRSFVWYGGKRWTVSQTAFYNRKDAENKKRKRLEQVAKYPHLRWEIGVIARMQLNEYLKTGIMK